MKKCGKQYKNRKGPQDTTILPPVSSPTPISVSNQHLGSVTRRFSESFQRPRKFYLAGGDEGHKSETHMRSRELKDAWAGERGQCTSLLTRQQNPAPRRGRGPTPTLVEILPYSLLRSSLCLMWPLGLGLCPVLAGQKDCPEGQRAGGPGAGLPCEMNAWGDSRSLLRRGAALHSTPT